MNIKNYIIIARPDHWFKTNIRNYIAIARPDHWFKNIFVLPGTVIAALLTHASFNQFAWPLLIGLISTCIVASANYVINEWLDAEFDRFHPVKKNRPSVNGNLKASLVYIEYGILSGAGLAIAATISLYFFTTAIIFLIMGILYNVRPFRTKDRVYLDVLSESINNPIRLMLGWLIVTSQQLPSSSLIKGLPPFSLLVGYWMGGAFLMTVKRYAEFKFINSHKVAVLYRRSFQFYTEQKLLISSFFYGMSSAFFLGVFLVKNRIELLLSLPFFAFLFTWYLHIGMKPNSTAQNPEHLYREKHFIGYIIFLVILVTALFIFDIPLLHFFLNNIFNE